MSNTVTVTWSSVRLTGLSNVKKSGLVSWEYVRGQKPKEEVRTQTSWRAADSCLVCRLKKKKKKNRNQYSKKVLKEPTATTPPWLSWVHNVFPVICLLGGGRICMESDLCWLCVTVLAVVWEVLRHKAFRKVIRYKTQTQFIFGWAGWMGSCILGQQIVFRYSKYIFQLQFGSV